MPLKIDTLLTSVLDHVFLGVLVVDEAGRIAYYNQRMGEIDELTMEETLGYKINEVYSVREADSPTMLALRSGKAVDGQFMAYRTARGRQINTLNHAYPLYDENGSLRGAVCLVTDVTSLMSMTLNPPAARRAAPAEQKRTVGFEDMIGKNPLFREAIDVAKVAARGPSPVMLVGETGTGKDLFARAIHDYGARAAGNFMVINCSAIPEALLEGILFGTTKGSFTGATDKEGLLEHASGGTLFLDEINSMPLSLQAKLLRVLQDHKVRRVGGLTEKTVDLRIISASNVSPLLAIENQTLRADLYYRLGVVQVIIPPLRERPEDIPPLARFFIERANQKLGRKVVGLSAGLLQSLKQRPWPGNVRELEHVIESAMNFVLDDEILAERHFRRANRHTGVAAPARPAPASPPPSPSPPPPDSQTDAKLKAEMLHVERARLAEALKTHGGVITRSAAALGLSPQLMSYKMKKHKLRREYFFE
jgi:arginine utilization regulatory protein